MCITLNVFSYQFYIPLSRDGVYYMLSITITLIMPSITITFQIFKSITITLSFITFYYFVSASK